MTTPTTAPLYCQLNPKGYFVGTVFADPCQIEPGVFYAPAGCIPEDPPVFTSPNQLARWTTSGWVLEMPPEPEPDPAHEPEPEPMPLTLEQRRTSVWSKIKYKRDTLKNAGVQAAGYWFHSDADSRIQQLGLVIMGANIPSGLQWKTQSGSMVSMTPQLAQQIFMATATNDAAIFAVAEGHRAAMMAAENPDDYDWQSGWPSGYTGSTT